MADIDFGAVRVLMKHEHLLKTMGPEQKIPEKEGFIEIDEIELEPIPISDESSGDNIPVDDEFSKPYGDFGEEMFPYKNKQPRGIKGYQKAQNLSSIPEESSIREMDNVTSSIISESVVK